MKRIFVIMMLVATASAFFCAETAAGANTASPLPKLMPAADEPVPDIIETSDIIPWQPTYNFHGHDFPLPQMDSYNEGDMVDYVLEYRDLDQCVVYRQRLTLIAPTPVIHCKTAVSRIDTVMFGYTYMFYDQPLTAAGTYEHTVSNSECDTVVTLTLYVNKVSFTEPVLIPDQCADADYTLDIKLPLSGTVHQIALSFSENAAKAGLRDTIMPMPASGELNMPLGKVRAGKYSLMLSAMFRGKHVLYTQADFNLLYPATVMEQRWNDAIVLLTSKYNGGYDFTAFQWYKNGQPLEGEQRSYLYQPLELDAEYQVLLTEADGTQLLSCPLVPEDRSDVNLYPTVVNSQQSAVRCHVSENATLTIYDALGRVMQTTALSTGDTMVKTPDVTGIYFARIVLPTGKERTYKLIVR